VLLLDSGDSLFKRSEAAASTDSKQGALPIEAMNAMGYDAMALGVMDLAPVSVVQARFQEADFPILSTNADLAGALPRLSEQKLVQPYLLRQMDGHTVAIIGATSEVARQRAQALGIALTVEDPVDAVRRTVEEVRDRADIIILLANLDQQINVLLAREVAGIDVIIGSYKSGQIRPATVEGPEGTVVLHASGVQGEYLGVLSLHFDAAGHIGSFEGFAEPLTLDKYADDPDIVRLIHQYATRP
jgi:2',3'-cyclic-nucleotide 2'-phosphodiesterase (5'-nucleotidase family)